MSNYKNVLNEIKVILGMEPEKPVVETEPEPVETEDIKLETTETKLAQSTLEDGTVVYYDGENIAVDVSIWADEAMETPVDDGEYVLENGDKFITEGGVVTEYVALTPEETEEETETEELEDVDFEKKYNDLLEIVKQLKDDLQEFRATETKLKGEIEKLSTQPEVESISQEAQDVVEISDLEKRLSTLDAIRKLRQK